MEILLKEANIHIKWKVWAVEQANRNFDHPHIKIVQQAHPV